MPPIVAFKARSDYGETHQGPSAYCTAMVTVLEVRLPMVSTTGTASPVGAFDGTWTFTW